MAFNCPAGKNLNMACIHGVSPEHSASTAFSARKISICVGIPFAELCSCSLKNSRILNSGAKLLCLSSEQYTGPCSKCYWCAALTVTLSIILKPALLGPGDIQPCPSPQCTPVKLRIISSAFLKMTSKAVPRGRVLVVEHRCTGAAGLEGRTAAQELTGGFFLRWMTSMNWGRLSCLFWKGIKSIPILVGCFSSSSVLNSLQIILYANVNFATKMLCWRAPSTGL